MRRRTVARTATASGVTDVASRLHARILTEFALVFGHQEPAVQVDRVLVERLDNAAALDVEEGLERDAPILITADGTPAG
jgi:hypothetical protein